MQRSFSIVDEVDALNDDEDGKSDDLYKELTYRASSGSESDENSPRKRSNQFPLRNKPEALPRRGLESVSGTKSNISSDSEDSDNEKFKKIPGEYDPKVYENLDVDDEIKEVFQYISKYTPQHHSLDYKFKPFIPEYLPAVGDIDAFLKVTPPERTLTNETFNENELKLGLVVLDEPASNQSDPALLHLQLRAVSGTLSSKNADVVVKKLENVEKNAKVIDKWIKDISHLHKSKSSPVVSYTQEMPDLDDLMQQWPSDVEKQLKENGFPRPADDTSVSEYVDTVCNVFKIPVTKNKIESLHLLFCLYSSIKQTQFYQASNKNTKNEEENDTKHDQLVLE